MLKVKFPLLYLMKHIQDIFFELDVEAVMETNLVKEVDWTMELYIC